MNCPNNCPKQFRASGRLKDLSRSESVVFSMLRIVCVISGLAVFGQVSHRLNLACAFAPA
eukprot:4863992-Alexandrium_andersonii.AAC.1